MANDELFKVLARNFKAERIRKEISREELAKKSGVSLNTIGLLERGIGNPTVLTLVSLALVLDIELNILLPLSELK